MQAPPTFEFTNEDDHAQVQAEITHEYLVSQIITNYAAATKRLDRLYKGSVPLSEEKRISLAWASYTAHPRGRNGATLAFTFNAPKLDFICDHDALLKINIRSVQNKDESDLILSDVSVTFRVATEWRRIVGNDPQVGDHESRICLLFFDFEHAKLVKGIEGDIDVDVLAQHDLERLLSSYLRSLRLGGHHVLFSLPEFDDDEFRPPISFSRVASSQEQYLLREIHGFSLAMINGYLSLLWYTCAFVIRERADERQAVTWDETTSLAEYWTWVRSEAEAWYCCLKFGAPEARILCGREVILLFMLSEVAILTQEVSLGESYTPNYTDWVIAVIVDVVATTSSIKIKTESARYSRQFSYQDMRTEHNAAVELLIDFFVKQYVRIVVHAGLDDLVRRHSARIATSVSHAADGAWWMVEQHGGIGGMSILDQTIRHTKMQSFEAIMAISQTSINNQIRARLSKFRYLTSWESQENHITLDIKSIAVRLLNSFDGRLHDGSSGKAVVMIHVAEGMLEAVLNPKDNSFDECLQIRIGECCIAFEVDVLEYDEHSPFDYRHKPYEEPPVGNEAEYLVLRHIYMDFAHARPSPENMSFDDFDEEQTARRVQVSVVERMRKIYLPALVDNGFNILASIPIYQVNAHSTFYKLTATAFRTYSAEEIEEIETSQMAGSQSTQILFVFGMTSTSNISNIHRFKPSTQWVVPASAGFSHGTFAISKERFMGRLHALLARVNALTTLVAEFPAYGSQTGADSVVRWADHSNFRDQQCDWKRPDGRDGALSNRLEWKYQREWSLHEEGSHVTNRGQHIIFCSTENELQMPDINKLSNGSLEINMSGTIRLRISSTGNAHAYITESAAFWQASIVIKTAGRGIVKVEINDIENVRQPPPKVNARRNNANNMFDAYTILKDKLPRKQDFDNILQELQELEGAWRYYYPNASAFTLCSPLFNYDGDLLFELRRMQGPDLRNGPDIRNGRTAGGRPGGFHPTGPHQPTGPHPSRPQSPRRPESPNGGRSPSPSSLSGGNSQPPRGRSGSRATSRSRSGSRGPPPLQPSPTSPASGSEEHEGEPRGTVPPQRGGTRGARRRGNIGLSR
ncbi:hypothetical protein C8Q74DRAFT_1275033 [Fomes fomentarius]|nr:hypothetical protein C8Q74DRAFT_1275033 [Fomes fomentarius]